jgi:FixJ family two-component response regulator
MSAPWGATAVRTIRFDTREPSGRGLALAAALPRRRAASDSYQRCLPLDVQMSEMEGLQLQGRLAAVGVELPLIVVSGQADVATTVRAMTAGAVDFIEKPYEADRLVKPLNRRWRRPADQPFAGIKCIS